MASRQVFTDLRRVHHLLQSSRRAKGYRDIDSRRSLHACQSGITRPSSEIQAGPWFLCIRWHSSWTITYSMQRRGACTSRELSVICPAGDKPPQRLRMSRTTIAEVRIRVLPRHGSTR